MIKQTHSFKNKQSAYFNKEIISMNFKIIRKIDALVRIVIPRDVRTSLGIENGTPSEIEVSDNSIILTKSESKETNKNICAKSL